MNLVEGECFEGGNSREASAMVVAPQRVALAKAKVVGNPDILNGFRARELILKGYKHVRRL